MVKPKVLVVDDEPDVVQLIEAALTSEGFDVCRAYDGISAIDFAETEKPDVVLLDIMMPLMSGYEVCSQLKSNPQTKHIPIVCVTSAHSVEARRSTQAAGAQALLIKPFVTAELIAKVRRYLPGSEAGATV